MHRLGCWVVIGALAVVVSVVGAGPAAAAKGGNNDVVKACQKHGWEILRPVAGGVFANQGDCVNDGAQGSDPWGFMGYRVCLLELGGGKTAFMTRQQNGVNEWSCIFDLNTTPSGRAQAEADLAAACAADTNNSPNRSFSVGPYGSNAQAFCFVRVGP